MGRLAALAALLALAALGGCGEADDPPSGPAAAGPAVDLKVVYDDGAGTRTTGTLTCTEGESVATGALDGDTPVATLCAQARGLADLLTTPPDTTRPCTQIYGGPQTARVTGTIGGKAVDRRFSRTNGCEIADFRRATGLLPPL